jgi:M6 family metalloprotease-like protein
LKIIIPIFFALILLTGTSGVSYESVFAQTPIDPPRQEAASPSDNNGNNERVFTGQLQIIWSHPNPNISSDFNPVKKYFLGGEESYELVGFEGAARDHGGPLKMNGKDIAVRAVHDPQTGKLIVKGIERAGNGSSGDDSQVYAASTIGSQKWATLPCKFADNSSEPRDLAYFIDLLDYTDIFWREASYDTINLNGSVELDWKTLPQPGSYYVDGYIKHSLIANDCAAVHNADVNFPDFDGINFILNEGLDCCAWGGSTYLNIDGQGKWYDATWMPPWAFNNMDILAHEMGHGFGLPHSSGPYGSTYDSQWDIMSGGGTCSPKHVDFGCIGVHTVSWHKDVLGWIDASDVYVDDGTQNQVVFIERLAEPINVSDPNVYQVVKIPTGSSNDFYTLEVRTYAGFDNIGKIPGEAVVIHKVDTTLGDRNAQVVVNPSESAGTNGPGSKWTTGETYQFPNTNTSVLIGDMANDGFTITLNPTGGNTPPQVTITSPANGSTSTDGDSVSFAGTATDAEDGDLAASIQWTSDFDGVIGNGASFNTDALSVNTHTITAQVTDSGSLSDSDTITITIDLIPNELPTAVNDAGTVDEGLDVNIDLASNDTDSDGTIDDASIVISSSPANGSVSVNADGTVNYTHDGSETLSDIFEYTIDDDDGATSNAATVSITVNPVNDAPIADDQNVVTDEGNAVGIALTGSDEESTITFEIVTGPTNGSLGVLDVDTGEVTYTPNENYYGPDSFTFTVDDGTIDSATATVSITVNLVNESPIADAGPDQGVYEGDDVILDGSGSSDPDNDPLTYAWIQTAGPSVSLSDPAVEKPTFIAPEFKGKKAKTLVFELTVTDEHGASSAASSIAITLSKAPATNNPPTANDDSAQTLLDTPVTIDVLNNDNDSDADSLSIDSFDSTGTLGSVAIVGNQIEYTPEPGFTGVDTFDYVATDGVDASNSATVTVTVNESSSNAPPTAVATYSTVNPNPLDVFVGDIVTLDGSGSSDNETVTPDLTFEWVKVSGPGKVTLSEPTAMSPTFTAPEIKGKKTSIDYTFQLTVTDVDGASAIAEVAITVSKP